MKKRQETFAEALSALGKSRYQFMVHNASVNSVQFPSSFLSTATQVKIISVLNLLQHIGRMPGDYPIPQKITYRKLPEKYIDWLESNKIPARSEVSPFLINYAAYFGGDNLPHPETKERFVGHLLHCLTLEIQLLIVKQYYYGSKLDQNNSVSYDNLGMDDDLVEQFRMTALNEIKLVELHGRIFLEYFVIMVRAQWDKLIGLVCLFFGIENHNWNSIKEAIKLLRSKNDSLVAETDDLLRISSDFLLNFLIIAETQLDENSWLQTFRNSLIHKVGKHSAGVIPQRKSYDSTKELWEKVEDEHMWLREAMIIMLGMMILNIGSQN